MSDTITIARPYAKAIFEYALSEKKLANWSVYLMNLAQTVMLPEVIQFIANPESTTEQHRELLQAATSTKPSDTLNNLIALLAINKRLMILPDISALYEALRAEQEKTMVVDVTSYSDLSKEQQQCLIDSLSKRLQRKVLLQISIDSSLLGGAIIQAGDLVIDGSVRGKLNKLCADLAA